MNPTIDPANELVWTPVLPPANYSTNNAVSAGINTIGFKGRPCLNVQIGIGTGTSPVVTLLIQTSATNNASNATNWNGTALAPIVNPTSNNAGNVSVQVPIDVRGMPGRFLFVRQVLTGTSPAFPIFAEFVGSDSAQ